MTSDINKVEAIKLAMNWWRSEKEASRQHLRRVSNLRDAAAITRYWLAIVATPEQLKQIGAI